MKLANVLREATHQLTGYSDTPYLDAEILLCHVLAISKEQLYTVSADTKFEPLLQYKYEDAISSRVQGMPIAYIIGYKEFWSMKFMVNKNVLIPRPETELLVEFVLNNYHNQQQLFVLDLGTGSGAIAISIARERSNWHLFATDISMLALVIAKQNAMLNQQSVQFIQANWLHSIGNSKFNIIIANPPYISQNSTYLQGDIRYEPINALVAGNNGFFDCIEIISAAVNKLIINGLLIIEHGSTQGQLIRALFLQYGFNNVSTLCDLSGLERVTLGYLS